jgi:PTS system nitrogen regulatory IIA component
MDIKDFLAPEHAFIEVRASNKAALLRELAERAASALNLPAEHLAAALLNREGLGSTATGGGIAIPHARLAAIRKPFGMLIRLQRPIDFDAIDALPVDIVFLLLLPAETPNGQPTELARVARKLRQAEALEHCRQARDSAELYSAMTSTP